MDDKIRCPACRGAKKVPKLGGMVGECNTCNGMGFILAKDKHVPVAQVVEADVAKLINSVADSVPASNIEHTPPMQALDSDKVVVDEVKVKGKTVFKRKRA